MDKEIQTAIDSVIQMRRQLAELERKRAEYDQDVPNDLWNKIVALCRWIDEGEQNILKACKNTSENVNQSREKIVDKLEEYNQWRDQMREFEDLFLTYIVRPGYRLKQAVRQREYLTNEYNRIRRAIEQAQFTSIEEVDREINQALGYSDTAFEADEESLKDEAFQEINLYEGIVEFDVDDLVEAFQKEDLVRDFKRIVLPAVHPDTSDADIDEFKTVFEVYERRDYLLMEAYIVQYKGPVDIEADPEKDPIKLLEELESDQAKYNKLSERFERRIEHLKKEMHPEEFENPEQLRDKFIAQREELRLRIQEESEKILQLRDKIENLSQYFVDRQ